MYLVLLDAFGASMCAPGARPMMIGCVCAMLIRDLLSGMVARRHAEIAAELKRCRDDGENIPASVQRPNGHPISQIPSPARGVSRRVAVCALSRGGPVCPVALPLRSAICLMASPSTLTPAQRSVTSSTLAAMAVRRDAGALDVVMAR